ncbi:hypothetical protein PENTCL1PPCAC_23001 [Pristionchus entomophagus]|uniref:Uncharacterized protein n=1 Tax=Pristionchus entomophagus TaxID=358040 RepID=A0AAV5U2U9_9BILA|nr:hypothetical protein PENTCL1PPCAC_23000 [Pristionchus entomophagus]GMT00827.1 hypothetical protein PENTCL1PPCAC_23001 [Pristionchus entomophagus]
MKFASKRIILLFYFSISDITLKSTTDSFTSQLTMAAFDQLVSLVSENRPEGFYSEMESTADQIVRNFDEVCV